MIDPFTGDLQAALQDANRRISKLNDSVLELCNLVMVLSDNCRDQALKTRAESLVKRIWEQMI